MALCALLLLPAASCSKKQTTTVRLAAWGDAAEIALLKQFVQTFAQVAPQIKIELLTAPDRDGYLSQLEVWRKQGRAPDLIEVDTFSFPAMQSAGKIRDLSGRLDDLSDFQPRLVECFSRAGKLWAVPNSCSPLVLYFNKGKFDRAGVPYPNESWDWRDFRDAAEKLTIADASGSVIQYGAELPADLLSWAPFLWQSGGEVMDPSTGQFVIGVPENLDVNAAALQFYVDLLHQGHVAPAQSPAAKRAITGAFQRQLAAMTLAGRELGPRLSSVKGLEWDVAALPRNRARATSLTVEGFAISQKASQPDAAWKVLRSLTGPTSQTKLAAAGAGVPARVSCGRSPVFMDYPGGQPKNNKAFLDSLYYARPIVVGPEWPAIEKILAEETGLLFEAGKGSAKDALIRAQLRIERLGPRKAPAMSPRADPKPRMR
ncbi:MAG: sugar ABC transporter substrate-binding protein [Verrucomicrobiae bacterium]|nr:sugar ABC transporter substrate-binding protein [Verrucomicrobiae bacterium]